jgi:hypothetical protein
MANAAEAAVAGSDLRLQHTRHAVAETQVGVPDDAGAQPALAVLSALTHRRRAVDEFDFADRLHLRGAGGAVHRPAFDKDALRDVVTAAGVGEQLVEQVAVPVAVPQMMVRIDDLERRLQDFLFPLRPPRRIAVARSGWSAAGHGRCGCGAGLRLYRGRAKYGAAKHARRSGQHCAPQDRMPANRLLSHGVSSKLFMIRISRICG